MWGKGVKKKGLSASLRQVGLQVVFFWSFFELLPFCMNFLLDTNVLLNDFFYRHPDFGVQRIHDGEQIRQVQNYRQQVHEGLLFLSLQKEVKVWSSVTIIARFGALLGDLLVPPPTVEEEMEYWLSQVQIIDIEAVQLHKVLDDMKKATHKMDFDDYLLKQICHMACIDSIVTSLPKSKEFFWPILVFKPEKLVKLKFETEL